jgi:glyoxylase-like metal-dependent hydrolase (beta-lactamase superfamily II)
MQILTLAVGKIMANCYIVWDENKNAVVIDPGDDFSKIKNKLIENNLKVQKIIFTHGHFDHISAAKELKDYTGAEIVAYCDEKVVIENDSYSLGYYMGTSYKRPKVDVFVSENDTISCGNLNFKVIHTPGHTMGGMCLFIDNILFSGDTIFKQYIGRCDHPTGMLPQLTSSILTKVFALPDDTTLYPGHGETTTIKLEKQNNEVFNWI